MPSITILGLGPGDARLLTREAWETLMTASEIYLRTSRHPTVAGLPPTLQIHSFDGIYESTEEFESVYQQIIERVLELGNRSEGVLYGVPGHPAVAESTVSQIRARATVPVKIISGMSFLEPMLLALHADALPNLQLADALDLATRHHPNLHPDAPAIIVQLYSATLTSDVKLTLMNQYPDDHPVKLVHGVGTPEETVEEILLFEIDRSDHIAHLTALYVPPLPQQSAFESLQETVAHLRAPEGCPWDKEQTHQTLRGDLIEEAYEVLAALDADDPDALSEELGDLLLQVVMHAQIATEYGEFHMADVIAHIQAKLIRRHPHVFGEVQVSGTDDVLKNWEKLKAEERQNKPKKDDGVLGSIPKGLPALLQAEQYQRRAARVGFDWKEVSGVKAKITEEIAEIETAEDDDHRAKEVGDLLFAVVNWARWLNIEPETALRVANQRFAKRFRHVEEAVKAQGKDMKAMTLEELDALWEQAKAELDNG